MPLIFHTEAGCPVFLGNQHNWACAWALEWLDDFLLLHLPYHLPHMTPQCKGYVPGWLSNCRMVTGINRVRHHVCRAQIHITICKQSCIHLKTSRLGVMMFGKMITSMSHDNGRPTRQRLVTWVNRHVAKGLPRLDAERAVFES